MGYIRQDDQNSIPQDFWRDDLDDRPIMVSIHCITYNHEKYIRDALEGFVNQRANFRFEAIVHDDASTDGTADIIREYAEKYPSIIKPIYETENQYSKKDGSLTRIMNEHMRGKYIAYCEGDDYWTDPYKLQKQVDFLEANPEYGLVHTNYKRLYQESGRIVGNGSSRYQIVDGYVFEELFRGCWIKTLTVMLRRDLLPSPAPIEVFGGDIYIFFNIALKSKVFYLDDETGVYRELSSSACHISDDIRRKEFQDSLKRLDYWMIQPHPHISKKTILLVNRKWFENDIRMGIYMGDNNSLKCLNYIPNNKNKLLDSFFWAKKLGSIKAFSKVIRGLLRLRLRLTRVSVQFWGRSER